MNVCESPAADFGFRNQLPAVRAIVVAIALTVVAAACGGDSGPLDVGIRRVALSLVFQDETLAEPVKPETIIRLVPVPPEVQEPIDLEQFRRPSVSPPSIEPSLDGSPLAECPVAPAGAAPKEAVTFDVTAPPAIGAYPRHNTGTIDISGGSFPITLPYPFITRWEIPAVEDVLVGGLAGTVHPEYDVHKIASDTFQVIDRLRLNRDDGKIQLVRRTTITEGGEQVFEPSPPIDVYVFGVEGSSWRSAGVDEERGTAMVFEGAIEKREVVDACGEVLDTYRVVASERMVNLRTGETSGTADDDPNVYNIATQFGGMTVREDIHMTFTTRDPESGSPLIIELDYVSTLDSIEPEPLDQ